jgi:hypothetical protein
MVSLFEVFYVFFINLSTLNSHITPKIIHHVQVFKKVKFVYFHERDSREPKVTTIALSVQCSEQFVTLVAFEQVCACIQAYTSSSYQVL